jgi:hypothetical protein
MPVKVEWGSTPHALAAAIDQTALADHLLGL